MNYDNGIKYAGDEEMYKADLKLWLRYTQDRKNEIRKAYDNKNADRCYVETHSLKSNAKRIGADELSEIAYKMEKAAKDGDWMSLGRLMQPLMEECLMAYDSDGAVDAADNILGYEISPDVRDKLTRIRNAADEFDYRGALILTEALPSHP